MLSGELCYVFREWLYIFVKLCVMFLVIDGMMRASKMMKGLSIILAFQSAVVQWHCGRLNECMTLLN